ncbi:MATA-HMG [Gigaspora margarita]|uniref:MATA-HMG n=1 Tax=Gigaspora margarita TaxID=4874 RepID=A0A8H3XJB1_GIGMA|nr:MATA-HMG [Gigaspora margarita]
MLPRSENDKNFYSGIKKMPESNTSDRPWVARSDDPPSENDHHEQEENPIQSGVLHSDNGSHTFTTNQKNLGTSESNSAPIVYNKLPQFKISAKPPFPPTIKSKDLVNDLFRSKSQPPKMLNEFFIYRKAFVQELKKQKLRVKMTLVSSQASIYWHQETPQVKEAYRKLARETEREYIQEKSKRLQQTSNLAVNSAATTSALTIPALDYNPLFNGYVQTLPVCENSNDVTQAGCTLIDAPVVPSQNDPLDPTT